MYDFDWSSIVPSMPYLLAGLVITLKITVIAIVVGIVWGTLLAVMRLSSFLPLAWFAKSYVNVFRSIPLVMVLLWFYLIVPGLPAERAGTVAENGYSPDLGDGGVFDVRSRLLFRDYPRRHSEHLPRPVQRRAGVGDDPLAVNAAGDPAAGLPRHGAAAANPGDRPVPGYLAGVCIESRRLLPYRLHYWRA